MSTRKRPPGVCSSRGLSRPPPPRSPPVACISPGGQGSCGRPLSGQGGGCPHCCSGRGRTWGALAVRAPGPTPACAGPPGLAPQRYTRSVPTPQARPGSVSRDQGQGTPGPERAPEPRPAAATWLSVSARGRSQVLAPHTAHGRPTPLILAVRGSVGVGASGSDETVGAPMGPSPCPEGSRTNAGGRKSWGPRQRRGPPRGAPAPRRHALVPSRGLQAALPPPGLPLSSPYRRETEAREGGRRGYDAWATAKGQGAGAGPREGGGAWGSGLPARRPL